jgi:hypothetical protein
LEEKEVAKVAAMDPKGVRRDLSLLFQNRLLSRSEVPRRADHQPNKIFMLFHHNTEEMNTAMKQILFLAVRNVRARTQAVSTNPLNVTLEKEDPALQLAASSGENDSNSAGSRSGKNSPTTATAAPKEKGVTTADKAKVSGYNHERLKDALKRLRVVELGLSSQCILFSSLNLFLSVPSYPSEKSEQVWYENPAEFSGTRVSSMRLFDPSHQISLDAEDDTLFGAENDSDSED